MNLEGLTPEPWTVCSVPEHEEPDTHLIGTNGIFFGRIVGSPGRDAATDTAFIWLARKAFGVMQRRGWGVVHFPSGWTIAFKSMSPLERFRGLRWQDPFTALVEADDWWRRNIDGGELNLGNPEAVKP